MKLPGWIWFAAAGGAAVLGLVCGISQYLAIAEDPGSSAPASVGLWTGVPFYLVAVALCVPGLLTPRCRTPRPRLVWTRTAVVAAVLVCVFGTLAVGVVGAWGFQRDLVYRPARWDPGSVAEQVPGAEDAVLHTSDGLTLHAWLLTPSGEDRRTAVLYLPGNAGNREGRLRLGKLIAKRGYTVLLLDYRGFGGNPGAPSEDGLARDASAAAGFLRARGFPSAATIYVGESIGTGVAARLAADTPPAAVLLRSPYTSLDAVAQAMVPLPVGLLLRDHFNTIAQLPRITCPVMVVAGEADTLVPPEQSRTVAARARHLYGAVFVPGATHNDPRWFRSTLVDLIDELATATVRS